MKREPLMSEAYFADAIEHVRTTILDRAAKLQSNTGQIKKPGILARANLRDQGELLVLRYSAGEPVSTLSEDLPHVITAWEASIAHSDGSQGNDLAYLDDYVRSLWIVSLGLIFKVNDALWHRILACVANEGRDRLLERLAGRRTPGRAQAQTLLHPKAYALLDLAADQSSPAEMARFLKAWYPALRNVGWHDSHKGPDGGGFFGYWAIESAGVALAFGIDDVSFRDLPFYPRDLAEHGRRA